MPKNATPPVVRSFGWDAVPGADLYNIVFVRNGKRTDRWVKTTTLSLEPKSSAKAGPTSEYRWYVYPLFREQDGKFRFGKLLADGSANIPNGALAG